MNTHDHSPTRQQIAERAYEIYLLEGKPAGHAMEHWLQAEAELKEGLRKVPVHVLTSPQRPGKGGAFSEGAKRSRGKARASSMPVNEALPKDGVLCGDKKTGKAGERAGATGNREGIQEIAHRVMGSRQSQRSVERSGQRRQPKRGHGSQKAKN